MKYRSTRRLCLVALACAGSLGFSSLQNPSAPQPSPEVAAILQRGKDMARANRADAIRLFEEAAKTAQDQNDTPGQAAAYSELAAILRRQVPPRAIEYWNQALDIYTRLGDKQGQAKCLTNLGNTYQIMAKQDKALELLEAGRKLHLEIGNQAGVASALNGIGTVYARTGQPRRALPYFEESRALYEAAGKSEEIFGIVSNIAVCYGMGGEVPKALAVLKEALTLIRGKGLDGDEGVILTNIGVAHSRIGELRESIDYLRQAIPLLEKAGIRKSVATCLIALSNNNRRLGNLLESLSCAQRAYDIQLEVQDSANAASALLAMAGLYTAVGDRDQALECYRKALKTNDGTGDLVGRMHILNGLGNLLGKQGKFNEEQACYEEVLKLQERAADSDTKARAYMSMAESYKRAGNLKEAIQHTREALALYLNLKNPGGQADCEHQLGELQRLSGDNQGAVERFRAALELNRGMASIAAQATCLASLARVTVDSNEKEKQLAEALMLIEGLRESLGGLGEAKAAYLEHRAPIYQDYIRFLLGAKKDAVAFEWAQKSKARVLLDLLSSGQIDVSSAMSEADRKQEQSLIERRKTLSLQWLSNEGERAELSRRGDAPAERVKQATRKQREIEDAQKLLERDGRSFREQLYARNPQIAYQRGARVASLSGLSAALPADTALLEYTYLPARAGINEMDQVALFLITRQSGKPAVKVNRTPLPRGEMERLASEFRNACSSRPGTPGARSYQTLSRRLFRSLIGPVVTAIRSKRRLIICPDGPLWDIPFQALLDSPPAGPSAFLLERFDIVYGYSATGIKAAIESRGASNRPRPAGTLLAMANPDFEGDSGPPGSSRRPYERGGLSPLPHTRDEARAIAAVFSGAHTRMGKDAQEAAVKRDGPGFRYLHFATHALVNDAAPMLSGVVLARPPKDSPEDGIFSVRELVDMRMSADMIVFSACNTGRGERKTGEGMIGLTWASLIAGVPSQVVSQWAVDDEVTAGLMARFYKELKSGKPKDSALRAAALATLRFPKRGHPFYWAPFVLHGAWR